MITMLMDQMENDFGIRLLWRLELRMVVELENFLWLCNMITIRKERVCHRTAFLLFDMA